MPTPEAFQTGPFQTGPVAPGQFVLCADDYAMTPGVTRGILALLEAGRVTATGAMTNMPHWPDAARALAAFEGRADLGVHLNLTCGRGLTQGKNLTQGNRSDEALDAQGVLPALGPLLARAMAGRLPLAAVEAEFDAQLAEFEDRMGRPPDFVDGHQHVHAMPGIRRALARVLARRYPGKKPYVRDAADRLGAIVARRVERKKAALVAALANPFGGRMRALGFALNEGFSGFSAFDPARDYGADFAAYLVSPGPMPLVMCHPGEVDDALVALDPATQSRPGEVAFFLSDRFVEICAAAGMVPARFSAL